MGRKGLMVNVEGYSDPTAGRALTNVSREERHKRNRGHAGVESLKPTSASLRPLFLMRIANKACEAFDIAAFRPDDIFRLYETGASAGPFVRSSDKGLVWVDRWYVAVEPALRGTRYLYITRRHIIDEEQTYARMAKERKNSPEVPEEIVKQFDIAKRAMEAAHRQYYIFRRAEDFGIGWAKQWRELFMKDVERYGKAGA